MLPAHNTPVRNGVGGSGDQGNGSSDKRDGDLGTLLQLEEIHAAQRSLESTIVPSRRSQASAPPASNNGMNRAALINWINGQPSVYPEDARGSLQECNTPDAKPHPPQPNRWYVATTATTAAVPPSTSTSAPPFLYSSPARQSLNPSHGFPALKTASSGSNIIPPAEHSAQGRWKAIPVQDTAARRHSTEARFIDLTNDSQEDNARQQRPPPDRQPPAPLKRKFHDMTTGATASSGAASFGVDSRSKWHGEARYEDDKRRRETLPATLGSARNILGSTASADRSLIVKLKLPLPKDDSKVMKFVPTSTTNVANAGALAKPRRAAASSRAIKPAPLTFNVLREVQGFHDPDPDPDLPYVISTPLKQEEISASSKHGFSTLSRRLKAKTSAAPSIKASNETLDISPSSGHDIPQCPRHGNKPDLPGLQPECDSDCFEEYDPLDDVEEVRVAVRAFKQKRPSGQQNRGGSTSRASRARLKAPAEHAERAAVASKNAQQRHPYLSKEARSNLHKIPGSWKILERYVGYIIHESFSPSEVDKVWLVVHAELGIHGLTFDVQSTKARLSKEISRLKLAKAVERLQFLAELASPYLSPRRHASDILHYLQDTLSGAADEGTTNGADPDPHVAIHVAATEEACEETSWNKLILERQLGDCPGNIPRMENKSLSTMRQIKRFEEGSSDVVGCSWSPCGNKFALACTTYSDIYNQAGNLVIGDMNTSAVKFLHGHHTLRPPDQGNAAILDPLLHSTVTSVKFSSELLFSSSYDCTVKIWRAEDSELLETIRFDDKVVELCLSDTTDRLAAAGCKDGQVSIFRTNEFGRVMMSQHLAAADDTLYPSTMVWGLRGYLADCLVVGYDNNINDVQSNHGDLRLINVQRSDPVATIRPFASRHFDICMDVEETLLIAGVAAPPSKRSSTVQSHVRMFDLRQRISHIMELDSPQEDLNKVTISYCSRFVTSSGTDDQTIVFDTRMPDEPLCYLKHDGRSASHQEFVETGVTFAAWTVFGERLVTGGSDGVIKLWDPRLGDSFCEDLATVTGPITSGAFSPTEEYLLIGECTGKATVLAISDPCPELTKFSVDRGASDDPPEEEISGIQSAAELLASGRVVLCDVGDGMKHAFGA